MNKLNLGCGSIQPMGWDNVDIDPQFDALLEVPDKKYDIVVAHCMIQLIPIKDLTDFLYHLRRNYMADKAVIRISLPDIEAGYEALARNNIDWFPNSEPDINDRFSHWLTWYSTSVTLLTPTALANKLAQAGFTDICQVSFLESVLSKPVIASLDTREGECFFMEAMNG